MNLLPAFLAALPMVVRSGVGPVFGEERLNV